MYDFSSTEEAITFSLADFSIGSNSKYFIFKEPNNLKSDPFFLLLPCHCAMYVAIYAANLNILLHPDFYTQYRCTGHTISVGSCEVIHRDRVDNGNNASMSKEAERTL